jgi:hypothetical protein
MLDSSSLDNMMDACVINHNAKFFDLYTLGADGVSGGNDENKDIGNWE